MDNNDVDEEDFYKYSSSKMKTKTAQSLRPQEITLLMLLASPLMTMMISSNSPTTLAK